MGGCSLEAVSELGGPTEGGVDEAGRRTDPKGILDGFSRIRVAIRRCVHVVLGRGDRFETASYPQNGRPCTSTGPAGQLAPSCSGRHIVCWDITAVPPGWPTSTGRGTRANPSLA